MARDRCLSNVLRRRELKFRHWARRFFSVVAQVLDFRLVANENNWLESCFSRKMAHTRERLVSAAGGVGGPECAEPAA